MSELHTPNPDGGTAGAAGTDGAAGTGGVEGTGGSAGSSTCGDLVGSCDHKDPTTPVCEEAYGIPAAEVPQLQAECVKTPANTFSAGRCPGVYCGSCTLTPDGGVGCRTDYLLADFLSCAGKAELKDECTAAGGTRTDLSKGPCSIQFGSAACKTCYDSKCLAECNACASNAECLAIIDCAAACPAGSTTCGQQCFADHPEGQGYVAGFIQGGEPGCMMANCAADCQ